MDQLCPRCSENNVTKENNRSAAAAAGLVGAMVASAAASYKCPRCGKIPLSEFPEEFQSQVRRKRVFMVVGAVGIFVAAMVLLVLLQSL